MIFFQKTDLGCRLKAGRDLLATYLLNLIHRELKGSIAMRKIEEQKLLST